MGSLDNDVSSFPPPALDGIDWQNLGFNPAEVAGHIESYYSVSTGEWSKPVWVKDPYVKIHGLATGLNYGQHTFEGVKAFRTLDGSIAIFRPRFHAERHQHSNDVLSMPPVPTEHFIRCLELAVGLNAAYVPPRATGGSMYIRPVSFGSSAQLRVEPPDEFTFAVHVAPSGVYHGKAAAITCTVCEDFDRTAPRGSGSAKCGGNYAPVMRWSQRARAQGYNISLHLDSQTRTAIDEFSTSGFIGLKESGTDGTVTLVVPASACIIRSSTSSAVEELARSELGWTVEHRRVPVEELADFVEVCAAGTASALVPVKSIDMLSTGKRWEYRGMDGVAGPLVTKLLEALCGVQDGSRSDVHGWRHTVPDPATWLSSQQVAIDVAKVNGNMMGGGVDLKVPQQIVKEVAA